MLCIKLKYLDEQTEHRRQVAHTYMNGIKNPAITLPISPVISPVTLNSHVWHLFVIRCQNRDALQKYLADHGIQTLIHYPIPPHKQQAYPEWNTLSFPLTEEIHQQILSLPIGPTLTIQEASHIVEICNDFRVKE